MLETAAAAPRKSSRKAAAPTSEVPADFNYPPVRVGGPRRASAGTLTCAPQVTGDGMGILQHDSYLGQHRGHLAYRCALPTPAPRGASGECARQPR